MSRVAALAEMESKLQSGLSDIGNEHKQRVALQAIILKASVAKEPVLEWLVKQLGGQQIGQELPTVNTFKCSICSREFGSHHALCGHQKSHK
ncbi:hypothetical protein GO730_05590 [Spirosoma sp. HMF3257]|uniref:C2H2-type domain-containing protein n=1 Tax=Spirosoma telluris TaxID=2183553 RepID=A0A327NF30_9BACT|nr:hypothetical protein [Spirosoma telluris]RAI73950.1 hypothetical protein HMF3257_05560 [Spirosoma telluris]